MSQSQSENYHTYATMVQKFSAGFRYSLLSILIGAQTLQISLTPESELYQRIEPSVTFIVFIAGVSATMVLLLTATICVLVDLCIFFNHRSSVSQCSLLPKPATETPAVVRQYVIPKAGYHMLILGLIILDAVAWSGDENRHTLFMGWLVEALKFEVIYPASFVGFIAVHHCIAWLVKKWKATRQPAIMADPENVSLVDVTEDANA